MREVLRLVDVTQQSTEDAAVLRNYNLEVYAGDIVVVCGMAGSGLNGLLSLLNGAGGLVRGEIWIDEQPVPVGGERSPLWNRISIFSNTRHQFDRMTVAENLALFSDHHSAFTLYNDRAVNRRAARYLEAEGLNILPTAQVASLSFFERQQLNLMMAKMAHASLIVMDCTEAAFGEDMSESLRAMIRRFQAEGMAFLLISYRDSIYEGLATRFQKIAYGTDIMEWDGDSVLRESTIPPAERQALSECMIDGICDEAINFMDIREYLCTLRRQSPAYWEQVCGFPIPSEGRYMESGVVLIPKESGRLLAENLSIEDNITLTIPQRIQRGPWGYIPPRLSRMAAQEFYRVADVDAGKRETGDLTLVERKILAIYRWAQRKPEVMVLAIPHYGMDHLEAAQLDRYLFHLVERGIRLVILSDSMQELGALCRRVTVAQQGQNARVLTAPTMKS